MTGHRTEKQVVREAEPQMSVNAAHGSQLQHDDSSDEIMMNPAIRRYQSIANANPFLTDNDLGRITPTLRDRFEARDAMNPLAHGKVHYGLTNRGAANDDHVEGGENEMDLAEAGPSNIKEIKGDAGNKTGETNDGSDKPRTGFNLFSPVFSDSGSSFRSGSPGLKGPLRNFFSTPTESSTSTRLPPRVPPRPSSTKALNAKQSLENYSSGPSSSANYLKATEEAKAAYAALFPTTNAVKTTESVSAGSTANVISKSTEPVSAGPSTATPADNFWRGIPITGMSGSRQNANVPSPIILTKPYQIYMSGPATPADAAEPVEPSTSQHKNPVVNAVNTLLSRATNKHDTSNATETESFSRKILRRVGTLFDRVAGLDPLADLTGGIRSISTFAISIDPFTQGLFYMRLEVLLTQEINEYLMREYQAGHLTLSSLQTVLNAWKHKGRPVVSAFRFDLITQREIFVHNVETLHLAGIGPFDKPKLVSVMAGWKSLAGEIAVRTFCQADSAIKKHLFEALRVLELINACEETRLAFHGLKMEMLRNIYAHEVEMGVA